MAPCAWPPGKVLDLTRLLPGPLAGKLLGDLGFPVVKVEPPQGDPLRDWAPEAYRFLNGEKEVLTLDLKRGKDRERLLVLVREAAVLLESNRPGVMERMGLGPEVLLGVNPAWSTPGFGVTRMFPTLAMTSPIWRRRGFSGAFPGDPSSLLTWQAPMP